MIEIRAGPGDAPLLRGVRLRALTTDPQAFAAGAAGAGRRLVAAVRAWVRGHGGRFVRLGVFERDGGAEGFYTRLGFVAVDDFPWRRDPSRRVIRMVRPA